MGARLERLVPGLSGRAAPGLVPLEDALSALGSESLLGEAHAEVPLAGIVGTAARAGDFDAHWRLRNRALADRWGGVRDALAEGRALPPVQLVRLGELYFVIDGHHRVSAAVALAHVTIPARVRHICTIAYGMCCLRVEHLPQKAAERAFLQRVPLQDADRTDLWLDDVAAWGRLADAAEAWGFRRSLDRGGPSSREELALRWWTEEVVPAVGRARADGSGVGLRDIELYAHALRVRDLQRSG